MQNIKYWNGIAIAHPSPGNLSPHFLRAISNHAYQNRFILTPLELGILNSHCVPSDEEEGYAGRYKVSPAICNAPSKGVAITKMHTDTDALEHPLVVPFFSGSDIASQYLDAYYHRFGPRIGIYHDILVSEEKILVL